MSDCELLRVRVRARARTAALKVAAAALRPYEERESEVERTKKGPFYVSTTRSETRKEREGSIPRSGGWGGRSKKRDTRKFLGQRNLWTGLGRERRRGDRQFHSTEGK